VSSASLKVAHLDGDWIATAALSLQLCSCTTSFIGFTSTETIPNSLSTPCGAHGGNPSCGKRKKIHPFSYHILMVIFRLHVFMFGALLILATSSLFLVQHQDALIHTPEEPAGVERRAQGSEAESAPKPAIYAIWSASVNLSCVILFMTCIALLNRSLDKPKTLVVNSRWIRMAPRIPIIAIICCLPLIKTITVSRWFGIVVCLLYVVFWWEWIAGLERNWQMLEPKDE